ncbi:hypothetical protein H5410_011241 [Solanum commersonii]|uniref:Uncharacterized protein n=1 Tax=Solanum commersonii TaxID=4109 RepID=A0A9J6APL5_SOLCO|nr:hypothetical protein H5410_011241 [Solanum commersonii]
MLPRVHQFTDKAVWLVIQRSAHAAGTINLVDRQQTLHVSSFIAAHATIKNIINVQVGFNFFFSSPCQSNNATKNVQFNIFGVGN